ALLARLRNVHVFEQRMVADHVRRVSVRDLPHEVAAIEVDRVEHAVRRLEERQTLYLQAEAATAACWRRTGRAGRRCSRAASAGSRARGRSRAWRSASTPLRRVGRAPEAGAFPFHEWLTGRSRDVANVREPCRRFDEADRRDAGIRGL